MKIKVNEELLAAFASGNTTAAETLAVIKAAKENEDIRALLDFSDELDKKYAEEWKPKAPQAIIVPIGLSEGRKEPPFTARAATTATNDCVLACEKYVLLRLGREADYDNLKRKAEETGLLQEGGIRLDDIGRLLESGGLSVVRKYNCTIKTLQNDLLAGSKVIVAVDGSKLSKSTASDTESYLHAVVVTNVSTDGQSVEVHDPNSSNSLDTYPSDEFVKAWEKSRYFAVIAETGNLE